MVALSHSRGEVRVRPAAECHIKSRDRLRIPIGVTSFLVSALSHQAALPSVSAPTSSSELSTSLVPWTRASITAGSEGSVTSWKYACSVA